MSKLLYDLADNNGLAVMRSHLVRQDGDGYFLYDDQKVCLTGKFILQFNVPASSGLDGVVTFYPKAAFVSGAVTTWPVTVTNNDPVNSARFLVEVEGQFLRAVVSGAGVTCSIFFNGYAKAV